MYDVPTCRLTSMNGRMYVRTIVTLQSAAGESFGQSISLSITEQNSTDNARYTSVYCEPQRFIVAGDALHYTVGYVTTTLQPCI